MASDLCGFRAFTDADALQSVRIKEAFDVAFSLQVFQSGNKIAVGVAHLEKHELAVFFDQFRAVSPKVLRVFEVEKEGFIDLLELSAG